MGTGILTRRVRQHRWAAFALAAIAVLAQPVTAAATTPGGTTAGRTTGSFPGTSLTLSQTSTATHVGDDVTIVATFTPGGFGGPFSGPYEVDLEASGAGPTLTRTLTLDAANQSTWTYHRSSSDITRDTADHITGAVDVGDSIIFTAQIDHTWRVPPVVAVSLSPSTGTSHAGSTATVVARVTVNGITTTGVPVTFTAHGSAGGQITRTIPTASSGARFSWPRTRAGTDSITAVATVRGVTGRDSARWTWTAAPVARLSLTLTPSGVSTPVGATFSVTARVALNGVAVSGPSVHFLAHEPGRLDRTGRRTLVAGAATYGYTRPTAGAETITATVTTAGQTVSRSIPHTWITTPTTPPASNPPASTPPTPSHTPPSVTSGGLQRPTLPGPGGQLIAASSPPGGSTTVAGSKCPPGSPVTLEVDDATVGQAVAGPDGRYKAEVVAPERPLGRYDVTATCGDRQATGHLDLVGLTSGTGTAAAASVTSSAILVFFALLVFMLLRVPGWGEGWLGRAGD